MAAESFLRNYPGLNSPFVLSDVQLTGTRIGGGADGRVEEVNVRAAAKISTPFCMKLTGPYHPDQLPKAAIEFVNECQLLSKMRHSNIF